MIELQDRESARVSNQEGVTTIQKKTAPKDPVRIEIPAGTVGSFQVTPDGGLILMYDRANPETWSDGTLWDDRTGWHDG